MLRKPGKPVSIEEMHQAISITEPKGLGNIPINQTSRQVENRKELLQRYLRAAWVLKIRLMSARLQLWAAETSIIHVENSVLQIRKACETICHMSLLAAEIDLVQVSKTLYDKYDIGAVFKALPDKGQRHFPRFARLSLASTETTNSTWELKKEGFNPTNMERLKRIFHRSGNLLHENAIYKSLDFLNREHVSLNLNALRSDNQWLWNTFWHHSIDLQDDWFFIDLGEDNSATQPRIIREEGLLQEDIEVSLDPDMIADFSGVIAWSQFSG